MKRVFFLDDKKEYSCFCKTVIARKDEKVINSFRIAKFSLYKRRTKIARI
jgi:hypothetical protein